MLQRSLYFILSFPFLFQSSFLSTLFYRVLLLVIFTISLRARAFVPTWWWTGCLRVRERERQNMENHFVEKIENKPYAVFYTHFVSIQKRLKKWKNSVAFCVYSFPLSIFTSLRLTRVNSIRIYDEGKGEILPFFVLLSVLPSINYSYSNAIAMDRTSDVGV